MTDQQVDITKMTVAELWKIAFEQQKNLTSMVAQIQQTQANIAAIEVEIATRKEPEPEKKK
jgi:thiamine biosynthesis lipoprotein ApbE